MELHGFDLHAAHGGGNSQATGMPHGQIMARIRVFRLALKKLLLQSGTLVDKTSSGMAFTITNKSC